MVASLIGLVVVCGAGFVAEWQTVARAGGSGGLRASFGEVTTRSLTRACPRSRRASRFLAVWYALAIAGAVGARLVAPAVALPGPGGWWVAAGFSIAILATALRGWSIVSLGHLFDRDALLHPDHVLVRHGPYRCVRHPAYAANIAFALAGGMILANWASLLVATLLVLIAHVPRIRFEEALLNQRFPNEYRAYSDQVGGLLPRFPRHLRSPTPH
jgi:protein-S-isoprenylcysteine O-methyltransferase